MISKSRVASLLGRCLKPGVDHGPAWAEDTGEEIEEIDPGIDSTPAEPFLSPSRGIMTGPLFLVGALYLLVPSLIVLFAFKSFPLPVAVAGAAAIAWILARAPGIRHSSRGFASSTWPYLLVAAAVVWLSGVLPPFAENWDWLKHYAIFNLLVDEKWPPLVATANGIATLRYSLSFYVVPSLAAKILGAWALPYAIFLWETLGLYLGLTLAFGWRRRGHLAAFALACLFFSISGADIIGTLITGRMLGPPGHIEWWAGFSQISSAITNVFWAPQHAIPGWVVAFLVLRYPARSLQYAGIICAAVAVWSPFVAVGLMPLFLWAILKCGPRELITPMNMLAAPLVLFSAYTFLTKGAAGIPALFIWDRPDFSLPLWLALILLEFVLLAFFLALVNRRKWLLLGFITVSLVALSLFSFGSANDLLMRGSIPLLAVLAGLSATTIIYSHNSVRKMALIACVFVGAITPLMEITRSITAHRLHHSRELELRDLIDANESLAPQYLVYKIEERDSGGIGLADLRFDRYGKAESVPALHRVASDSFTDGGLVSNLLSLPKGYYKVEAIFDWAITPATATKNGAHLSLHGKRLLVPIMAGIEKNKHVTSYFYSDGKPLAISFGLGGWSTGKGTIELKKIDIYAVR